MAYDLAYKLFDLTPYEIAVNVRPNRENTA